MASFRATQNGFPVPRKYHAWTLSALKAQIPDQTGRRVIITGANSGIGYPAALELARAGAQVLLAVRDQAKGDAALTQIRTAVPKAQVEVGLLDLASLKSVRDFASRERDRGLPLDVLINNAGIYAPNKRRESADGFELQFGTNVLGHFALTGLLLPAFRRASLVETGQSTPITQQVPRIVYVASIAHKRGTINFDDLQSVRSYNPLHSYAQTKLADLMLSFELDRRLRAAGSLILSVAAHPGVAKTNIFQVGEFSAFERAIRRLSGKVIGALLNSDAEGALPTIFAAVSPDAVGGGYYGPKGFQEMRGGDVGDSTVAPQARDSAAAARLWSTCEELTGIDYL